MKPVVAVLIALLLLWGAPQCNAAHKHLEKNYQAAWCDEQGGEQEVVIEDGARIDCLTDDYAIEFDFAPKWAESIGQALYYGLKTRKTPGVVLILEKPKADQKFLDRLNAVSDEYGIQVWTMEENDLR